MKRPIPEITESLSELSKLLKGHLSSKHREKIHALYLLKSSQAKTLQELSRLVNRHRHTISHWLNLYEQGGMEELLEEKRVPNNPSRLNVSQLAQLQSRLY